MLFNFKSKKKYFSLLLILVILFSSVRLDSLLVFAHSLVNNDESIVYYLDDATADYFSETEVEDVDETDLYDELEDEGNDLELDLIENEDKLDLDEQVLADDFIDNDDDIDIDILSTHGDIVQVTTFQELQTAINSAPIDGTLKTIQLTADISTTSAFPIIEGNRNIALTSDSNANRTFTLTGIVVAGHVTIGPDSTLTVGSNVSIMGAGSFASVHGTLNMESGSLLSITNTLVLSMGMINMSSGSTLNVPMIQVSNSASINMNGGTINSTGTGTAVLLNIGTLIMNGGTINGNHVVSSAGVNSTFYMNGGQLNAVGSGVNISNGGIFNMSDGIIIVANGNGVTGTASVASNTFNMTGGTINAGTNGVQLNGISTLNMTGGTINSVNFGVNVAANGVFTMNGGYIQNSNRGVNVIGNGTFIMNNGVIRDNASTTINGAGVQVNGANATFTMNNGEISGNTVDFIGGGVHVANGTFTMNNGVISGNTANNGGGIGWTPTSIYNITISSYATVTGNNAINGIFINNELHAVHGDRIQPNPGDDIIGTPPEHLFDNHNILAHEEQVNVRFLYNFEGAPYYGIFYQLSYVANGQPLPVSFVVYIMENPPIRADYTFYRWSTDPRGNEPFNFSVPIIGIEEVRIYAQWAVNETRTLTFDLAGGNIEGATANVVRQVRDGQSVSNSTVVPINNTIPTPTRLGFIFEDWQVMASDVTGVDIERIFTSAEIHTEIITGGNITLIARWIPDPTLIDQPRTFNVMFYLQGRGNAETVEYFKFERTVEYGETVEIPTIDPEYYYYYEFIDWFTTYYAAEEFYFGTPITQDIRIYAHWEPIEAKIPPIVHTVEFNLQGGVAHDAFANQVILHGEVATRPVINPERVGHIFIGWYIGNTAFNFTTPIVANTTIYARWSAIGTETPPSGGNQSGPGGPGTSPPGSGSGNQSDSGAVLILPRTGSTQRNMLLIGFGLLLVSGVIVYYLKKDNDEVLDKD